MAWILVSFWLDYVFVGFVVAAADSSFHILILPATRWTYNLLWSSVCTILILLFMGYDCMMFLNGMLCAHVKASYIWQPNYLYTIMYQHQQ